MVLTKQVSEKTPFVQDFLSCFSYMYFGAYCYCILFYCGWCLAGEYSQLWGLLSSSSLFLSLRPAFHLFYFYSYSSHSLLLSHTRPPYISIHKEKLLSFGLWKMPGGLIWIFVKEWHPFPLTFLFSVFSVFNCRRLCSRTNLSNEIKRHQVFPLIPCCFTL